MGIYVRTSLREETAAPLVRSKNWYKIVISHSLVLPILLYSYIRTSTYIPIYEYTYSRIDENNLGKASCREKHGEFETRNDGIATIK